MMLMMHYSASSASLASPDPMFIAFLTLALERSPQASSGFTLSNGAFSPPTPPPRCCDVQCSLLCESLYSSGLWGQAFGAPWEGCSWIMKHWRSLEICSKSGARKEWLICKQRTVCRQQGACIKLVHGRSTVVYAWLEDYAIWRLTECTVNCTKIHCCTRCQVPFVQHACSKTLESLAGHQDWKLDEAWTIRTYSASQRSIAGYIQIQLLSLVNLERVHEAPGRPRAHAPNPASKGCGESPRSTLTMYQV